MLQVENCHVGLERGCKDANGAVNPLCAYDLCTEESAVIGSVEKLDGHV